MVNQKLLGIAVVATGAMLLSACDDSDGGGRLVIGAPDPVDYEDRPAQVSSETLADLEQMYADMDEISDLIFAVTDALDDGITGPGNYDCEAGGSVSTDYDPANDDNEVQSETWVFDNCVVAADGYGQVRISGSVDADLRDQDTVSGDVWIYSVNYDEITGEVLATGEALALDGKIQIDELDAEGAVLEFSHLTETIDSLEMQYGDRYVGISGFESHQEGTVASSEYTIKGKLAASALDGYITLSTPVSVIAEDGYSCPTKGQINMAGEDTAELRFGETALGTGPSAALWIGSQVADSYDESECEELADLLGIETYEAPK